MKTASLLGMLLLMFVEASALRAGEFSAEEFAAEAGASWNRLILAQSCTEGTVRASERLIAGGEQQTVGPETYRINGILGYVPGIPDRNNVAVRIECQNDKYEFVVDKLGNNKWELRQLLWREKERVLLSGLSYSDADGTVGSLPWQEGLYYSCRGLTIGPHWVTRLFESPTCEVVSVTLSEKSPNVKLATVRFKNKATRTDGRVIESGELVFDTLRFWQIAHGRVLAHERRSGEGAYEIKLTMEIENEFCDDLKGAPFARRTVVRTYSDDGRVDRESIYETTLKQQDRTDVKPFTLPAFGLPSPLKGEPELNPGTEAA